MASDHPTIVKPKNRACNDHRFIAFRNHGIFPIGRPTIKDRRPGHPQGATDIFNQHLNGWQHHGQQFVPAGGRERGCSILAVVGLRGRRLKALTTMLIQGVPRNRLPRKFEN